VGLAIGTGGGINNQVTLTDHSIGNLGGGALMWGSGPGAFGNTLNIDATSALTNIFGLSLGEDNTTFYMTNSPSGFVLNGFTTNQLQFANGFGELVVGSGANGTALVISNYVLNSAGSSRIGSGYNAGFGGGWNGNNNSVLIAGPASVWSNSGPLVVGFWGCGNSLIITNGGQVFDADGHIGIGLQTNIMIRFYPDPPLEFVTVVTNNFVLVAGTGSTWNNSGDIYVGTTGSWNQLTIASGGQVFSANGYVGYDSNAVNNAVSVAGPGSVWNISGSLNVGYSGSSNSLTIADSGTVTASNVVIGPMDTSIGNLVTVSGGSLLVTNSSGGGLLDIRHGTLNLNDGLVYAGAVAVSNGSFLIGSGTIIGSVTNAGTMNPGNSPGTLNVQGDLTLLSSTVLDMELRGTATNEFDRLLVSGAFTADGILDVMLLDGFLPQPGDQFDLLNYASVSGGFDSMNLPFGVGSWDTTHLLANPSDPLSGTIIYIPEPSVSALMALGLAALGMRRRK
jgi:T5SS/PEP-CTERM-associated repeat protein